MLGAATEDDDDDLFDGYSIGKSIMSSTIPAPVGRRRPVRALSSPHRETHVPAHALTVESRRQRRPSRLPIALGDRQRIRPPPCAHRDCRGRRARLPRCARARLEELAALAALAARAVAAVDDRLRRREASDAVRRRSRTARVCFRARMRRARAARLELSAIVARLFDGAEYRSLAGHGIPHRGLAPLQFIACAFPRRCGQRSRHEVERSSDSVCSVRPRPSFPLSLHGRDGTDRRRGSGAEGDGQSGVARRVRGELTGSSVSPSAERRRGRWRVRAIVRRNSLSKATAACSKRRSSIN